MAILTYKNKELKTNSKPPTAHQAVITQQQRTFQKFGIECHTKQNIHRIDLELRS